MEIYDLHQKRSGSVDKKEGVICRLGKMWLDWNVTARVTRAIFNYTPIREYRQYFFPEKYTQCLSGPC